MAQIISLVVSIALAVAIFHVIGEIRRETVRVRVRTRPWPPQIEQEIRAESNPAAMMPSAD